jgi:hypothetical protein
VNSSALQIATDLTRAASNSGHLDTQGLATLPWFTAMHGAATSASDHYTRPVLDAAVALTEVELRRLPVVDAEKCASFFLDACVAVSTASELSVIWEERSENEATELAVKPKGDVDDFPVSVARAA